MRITSILSRCCVLIALAPSVAVSAEPNQLTHEQLAEGWVSLFDGTTLDGWRPTSDADWRVEEGEIRVSQGAAGWLMTVKEYGDFELHVEFQAPAATNSGVFLRTPLEPKDPARDCYELNIAPADNPFPTGSLVGRLKNPQLPLSRMINAGRDVPAGAFDIRVEGGVLTIVMDGGAPMTYEDPHPLPRGRIGLQFREGGVAFREIRIREIPRTAE